jgi:Aldehyde dehydrogenase family
MHVRECVLVRVYARVRMHPALPHLPSRTHILTHRHQCSATQRCPISLHARTYSHTDTNALPPHGPRMQAFFKSARVEFVPLGVIAAIVPWNWPFHNVINPISAAVMSGNAIVVKARKTAQ